MWKQEETSPFLYSNQDVADAILLYGKKTMGDTNFLGSMFHYFHDRIIPNLMKLVNSPSLSKYKDLPSLIEDE